jgi:hypothetical protein
MLANLIIRIATPFMDDRDHFFSYRTLFILMGWINRCIPDLSPHDRCNLCG